jgi:polysaccharide biosynthesis/export protein
MRHTECKSLIRTLGAYLALSAAASVGAVAQGAQPSSVMSSQEGNAPFASREASEGQSQHASMSIVLPAESLGKDDLLEIAVQYCPELSRNFRVGSDGSLSLPLLRKPIPVTGLTPSQVGVRIKDALIVEQIMADPVVNVSVIEYRSRTVSVVGAVVHPLTFQATGETTLLDALAMAGGLSPQAGPDILMVSTQSTAQGAREKSVRTIPVQELVIKGDPVYNPVLHGGEEIRIPETGKIFVAGNVVHPGMYPMQSGQDTTVLKALALSQGLQSYSSTIAYIYRRPASGGDRQEIEVPLSRIMARKDHDVPLIADDIFYIPEAKGMRLTGKILSQIAGFGQTTAAGLLIYK